MSWHHKISIKHKIIHPIVQNIVKNDPLYTPITGKILDYQNFYAMLCRNKIAQKTASEKKKEQINLVKTYDLEQISIFQFLL